MTEFEAIELLEQGYAWTAKRIAVVQDGDLGRPTPCAEWDLLHLLDHTYASGRLLSAMAAGEIQPTPEAIEKFSADLIAACRAAGDPVAMFQQRVAAASLAVWRAPGQLRREVTVPFGTEPATRVLRLNVLEVVVHGWDISQGTAEAAAIPDELAAPILGYAQRFVADPRIAQAFGPRIEVPAGAGPSAALVALLGRTPMTH